jgi:hypothetical protein
MNTPSNPAHSVRGPKYAAKRQNARLEPRRRQNLVDSIPTDSVSGLGDLALIAAMFCGFARVSAVLKLKVDDYYHNVTTPGLRFGSGPRRRVFSPLSDVTLGGQPPSRFTWRTTDGSSTPSRWPELSLREQPSSTTGRRMRLHSARWSESGCDVRSLCFAAQPHDVPPFMESLCFSTLIMRTYRRPEFRTQPLCIASPAPLSPRYFCDV